MFNAERFAAIAECAFAPGYPGYKPNVIEAPNGDGRLDLTKRYTHIAPKYLTKDSPAVLWDAFDDAYRLACEYARALHLHHALPARSACALRLLEYPAGAGSAKHTDFDLFTVNLWRSDPGAIKQAACYRHEGSTVHLGELWPLLVSRHDLATEHWVVPRDYPQQAMVFFALPAHDTELPDGRTVGEWLAERIARSRY